MNAASLLGMGLMALLQAWPGPPLPALLLVSAALLLGTLRWRRLLPFLSLALWSCLAVLYSHWAGAEQPWASLGIYVLGMALGCLPGLAGDPRPPAPEPSPVRAGRRRL